MSNAFEIFRTILTGTSNFMSAPIRVSVKSDRYANAHGFFPSEYFFPYSESMNRCRQLYFYHFLMIFFHHCSTCLSLSRHVSRSPSVLWDCVSIHLSFHCVFTFFCSLYHPPKSDFRWPVWLVLLVAQVKTYF